jgi:hypothetical protein
MKDKIFEIIAFILYVSPAIFFVSFVFWFSKQAETEDKYNRVKCTNVKKMYKNDILFDNFYIACDESMTVEIDAELFVRIEEGQDYIITHNKLGGLYSFKKD